MPTPEELLREATAALHARTRKQEEEQKEKEVSKVFSLPLTVGPGVTITLSTVSNVVLNDHDPVPAADDLPTAESIGHNGDRISPAWAYYCEHEQEYNQWDMLEVFTAWYCGEGSNIDTECDCGEHWVREQPTADTVAMCRDCSYLYHSKNLPQKIVMWVCSNCEEWYEDAGEANDCCPEDED